VALVSEVFWEPDGLGRLAETLDRCIGMNVVFFAAIIVDMVLKPF
jgi:hypothetical protein